MRQARGEQDAGERACTADPFGQVLYEALVVSRGMGEDLPAQEAVLGRNVVLDETADHLPARLTQDRAAD